MWSTVSSGVSRVVQGIIDFFRDLPSNMWNIGKNMVEGIWNGINNAKDWVLSKIKGFGQGIVDGIKNVFGIHSPSIIMRDKVGKNLILGLIEGITKNRELVDNSIKDLSEGIIVNSQDFEVDTNQFIDYSAINGQIQSNVSVNGNLAKQIASEVRYAMENAEVNVNIEAKTDEGVMVKKVAKGFEDYVMQTGDLPFPVPIT